MRILSLVFAVLALTGCATVGGTMTQAEQVSIMQGVSAKRQMSREAYASYSSVCLTAFPNAKDMENDGGEHFSEQGYANVSLTQNGERYVCSVDIATGKVDRVFVRGRALGFAEFDARRGYVNNGLSDAAKDDVDAIAHGEYAHFIKRAKRRVSDGFKDPDSVKWRDLIISNPELPTLCGQVNARNSYGGYVGYKAFFHNALYSQLGDADNGVAQLRFQKLYSDFCVKKIIDVE